VDHPIEVVVGPELIAGSTRLKAGSAQKLVLNMISTISMIRLGKTYGNLMVEVRATNEKLRLRALRIVQEVTAADERAAEEALATSGDDIKTAILMLLRDLPAAEAGRRLEQAAGHLRRALDLSA
jgi:N-acetylmuramic acid 6-phosphate etherase